MNNEEKLKEAKRLYQTANFDQRYVLESLFPELKDSEDERIRKELITHCRNTRCVTEEGAERIAKWIAWLEKQGTSYTKRDVDDAFVEGIALTKYELEKQCEKKPTEWSKEDERIYYSILADIRTKQDDSTSTLEAYYNEQISWLKSLKQRIGG